MSDNFVDAVAARFADKNREQWFRDMVHRVACDIEDRADLTEKEKARLKRRVTRPLINKPASEAKDLEVEIKKNRLAHSLTVELEAWLAGKMQLQKPAGSKLHHLERALVNDKIAAFVPNISDLVDDVMCAWLWTAIKNCQIFVVQHDWGAVIGEQDGELVLPYTWCCFEFRVSNRHVVYITGQNAGNELGNGAGVVLVECADGWGAVVSRPEDTALIGQMLALQVRAAVIALDAEVIKANVERAPYRLNRARQRRGDLPLYDYHTLSVVNRKRVLPSGEAVVGERRSPRLHFRRGHWRHFENGKTWVNWTLVGDPDLGFVEKDYAL